MALKAIKMQYLIGIIFQCFILQITYSKLFSDGGSKVKNNRIKYEMTNVIQRMITHDGLILQNALPGPIYFEANANVSRDVCWWEKNPKTTNLSKRTRGQNFHCEAMYGITGISVFFPEKNTSWSNPPKLPVSVSPMTNETIANLLKLESSVLDSVILSINKDKCYKYFLINEGLTEYLDNELKIVGPNKIINSSVKLGVEYNQNLLECNDSSDEDERFYVLRFMNLTVFRVEIFPVDALISYGLFSEMMKNLVRKNRDFVHNFNPNCDLFVRVVVRRASEFSDEINDRYESLVKNYLKLWIEQTSDDGTMYLVTPDFHNVTVFDSSRNLLRNKVSPVIFNYAIQNVNVTEDTYFSTCQLEQMMKTVSSEFNNLFFDNPDWEVLRLYYEKCQIASRRNEQTLYDSFSSFLFSENPNPKQHATIKWLVDNLNTSNIRIVYLANPSESWNTSTWQDSVNLLRSKNVQIGCYANTNMTTLFQDANSTLQESIEMCGPLFNISTEILFYWNVAENLNESIAISLYRFNEIKRLFDKLYPSKKIVPWIEFQEPQDGTFKYEANIKDVLTSPYCYETQKYVNQLYQAILVSASVHNWTRLILRAALDDSSATGWWRSIETEESINRSTTQYSVFVRSNADILSNDDEQLAMTYSCVDWTQTANGNGIDFLSNSYSGATIPLNLRETSPLTAKEMETLLQFAFGRFSFVEVLAVNSDALKQVKSVLSSSMLLKTLSSSRRALQHFDDAKVPFIYIEAPFSELHNIFDVAENEMVAVHISDWEHSKVNLYNGEFKLDNFPSQLGITVQDCVHEMNSNFTLLKRLPFIKQINYIVCNGKPKIPDNNNRGSMQMYFDTLFYTKTYMEKFLPEIVSQQIEVIFRINLKSKETECKGNDNFLRFLDDMNKHSAAYKIKYFVVKAFETEQKATGCPTSWWRLNSYANLTNDIAYISREDEHFLRPTKSKLLLLPSPQQLGGNHGTNDLDIFSVAVIMVVLVLSAVVLLSVYLHRTKKDTFLTDKELDYFHNGKSINSDDDDDNEDTDENRNSADYLKMKFPKHFHILKSNIKFGSVIGAGNFGRIHKGMLSPGQIDVAVKVPHRMRDKEQFKNALGELKIHCHIGTHNHVVSFFGAYVKEVFRGKVFIVMEYCEKGSLLGYLRSMQVKLDKGDEEEILFVDLYQLYKFSYEIASGMEYIASKGVIHGDLATRNVLLDSLLTCKIADFGLSRKLYNYSECINENKGAIPWRWLAPESLKYNKYTTKSDVWSYGVTLWEIFSLGMLPYPGLTWTPNYCTELDNGMRMEKAQHATDEVHETLLKCWHIIPEERSNFVDLAKYFAGLRETQYTKLY